MTTSKDLEACLREHGGGLRQLACALLGRSDADDAVQEVWLELLTSPPSRGGPLGGWLRTVLQRIAWQSRRGDRRRVARELAIARHRGEASSDHVDMVAREEQLHFLVAAVHALQPAFRDVVWQRFFEGSPPRAIAAATGEPVATVKSKLLRGLAQLRERLGAQDSHDWRAGLIGAFGFGSGAGTPVVPAMAANSWLGVWWMGAKLKVLVATCAVAAFGAWWWLAEAVSAPLEFAGERGGVSVAAEAAPVVPIERAAVTIESEQTGAEPSAAGSPEVAGTALVRGRLLDAQTSQPLSGVMVRWNRGSQLTANPDDPGTITDTFGQFELEVSIARGSATVIADAPGYVPRWASSRGLQSGQIDDLGTAALRVGRQFPVRVVDADSGVGVGGTMLQLHYDYQRASRWLETMAMGESASDGSCALTRAVPLGPCKLTVLRGDYELVGPTAFEVTADSPQELTVMVRKRPTIRGVVVDPHNQPVPAIGLSTQGMLTPETETATDGSFTLVRRLPAGGPDATLSLPDTGEYLPHAPLQGVPWGTDNLCIVLQPSAVFPIEVVDDRGDAVEHFAITLQREATYAKRHVLRQRGHHIGGRLDVEAVAPGATSLRVVPLEIEWAPSEAVTLGDIPADPVRVVVTRRTPCRVLVVRGDEPVADALVEYVHERRLLQVQHRSDLHDPREAVAPVVPQWPELVSAARTGADGIADLWRDAIQHKRLLRVRVHDEPNVVIRDLAFASDGSPLRVELPGFGRVQGRVLLAGRSHTDVSLRLVAGAFEPLLQLQPDGSFVSAELPAGPCRIELLLPVGMVRVPVDGLARDVSIEPAKRTEVEFDLSTLVPATVRGRVIADTPLPADLHIDFVRITAEAAVTQGSATITGDGSFRMGGLLPGTYYPAFRLGTVSSVMVPALQAQSIELVGGEDLVHDLRFVRRKLTVHFVWPDGTPARSHRTIARCVGRRCPVTSLFPPVRNETLVIDPAPAVPIEFGGWSNGKWSEPVVMPVDRLDAEVTVMLPGK